MTKSTITRAQALEFAIANIDNEDVKAVLGTMLKQVTKPRKATESKAHKMNVNLAQQVAKLLPAEGLTSKQITELGIPEITTTQKATAVMRVAVAANLAERVQEKKVITYKPIATEVAAE